MPYCPPHVMNRLIVDDLGNIELLVVACDDGDVIAYTIQSIHQTIEAIEAGESPATALERHVRPFFASNVGSSAWGLALHRNARLLAVSANTHAITVFAFALSNDGSSNGDSGFLSADESDEMIDEEWQLYAGPTKTNTERHEKARTRSFNQKIVLKGHKANIPDVAFCNSDRDLGGNYLVSTDIEGKTIVWDIWSISGHQIINKLTLRSRRSSYL